MTSSPPLAVFLDADVLAAPVTRSLILIASQQDEPPFQVRWSVQVEDEADRHLRPGQRRVSEIRVRFDWGTEALVDVGAVAASPAFSDTDVKDRHVAVAAHAAGVRVIVTRNVRHFGHKDLSALSLSAVDPDWFLAMNLTDDLYQATLNDICAARQRDPRTPEALHSALALEHPRLFRVMEHVFPEAEPVSSDNRPTRDLFRGVRCVTCGGRLDETFGEVNGVCAECGKRRPSVGGPLGGSGLMIESEPPC